MPGTVIPMRGLIKVRNGLYKYGVIVGLINDSIHAVARFGG